MGQFPSLGQRGLDSDFFFIEQEDPEEVVRIIVELCQNRIPKAFGLDPKRDVQVLSPMHRGPVGAANLNACLQEALNPGTEAVLWGGSSFRPGDKVMQIKNNYEKEVFNGDIGVIKKIDAEQREIIISFDGAPVACDFTDLDEIVLAYAVSVHKSQGSEYPAVVIPVMTQHYMLLQRNLLYTAVTRGKRLVVLVGTKKALAMAIKNDKTLRRYTRLRERLSPQIPCNI